MTVLGIDIGGSAIKCAPVRNGEITAPVSRVATPKSKAELLTCVSDIITSAQLEWNVTAVGIGIPGFIRRQDGVIVRSPNLLFLNETAFKDEITRRIPLPVMVDNDANCAALGAWLDQPTPRPRCLVHLTLGTGVGSGIILDGRPWRGACGYAAELGHVVVRPEGRACGCGGRGCAETETSETGILRTWTEARPGSGISSARRLHQLRETGDPDARLAFERAGRYLGILLADIVNFLNPEIITIGGGVAAAGEVILAPARTEMRDRLHHHAVECTRIEITDHADYGILGAARLLHKDSRS
ncbi:MAG: ROK family protein [Candidatus Aminicenantes bacterium]|nr:ROK family protein [Candidatus Aminicenantes bacterium]